MKAQDLARGGLITLSLSLFLSCAGLSDRENPEVQAFLDDYTTEYLELQYASAKAEWASNTRIVEGDAANAERTKAANEAFAGFTGSV